MKQLITLLAFIFLSNAAVGQKSINKLFDEFKKDENFYALKLPGWIIDSGLKLVSKVIEKEDKETILLFKDKIKRFRVLVNEKSKLDQKDALAKFFKSFEKDNLEVFANVKSEGTTVAVYIEEKDEIVKNVFFIINESETSVLLHLKTDLKLDEFKKANFSFNKLKKETI